MFELDGILAVDIGSGTQDILIYEPGREMENNVKLILPSQTQIIAKKIAYQTDLGRDIFLSGQLMGGGASSSAVKNHLKAGNKVYATKQAALTIKDDLNKVLELGVEIVESDPAKYSGTETIEFKDIDIPALEQALSPFGINIPNCYAFAVQDHGYSPDRSNRLFRFEHWQRFLGSGGELIDLLYNKDNLPHYFTRMKAVMEASGGKEDKIWLMDTGSAAIMGALEDERVNHHITNKGGVLVNVGNQHTIAFLVHGTKILGIFEHHTKKLTTNTLKQYLKRFIEGNVSNEEVLADKGHGCMRLKGADNYEFDFIAVTGPRREMAQGIGYLAVPHGDMMLSGSFGLVRSVLNKLRL